MAKLSLWHRLEAFGWLLAALFMGFFGNGHEDIVSIVLHDPRINR
jgi:hypothetical protein